MIKLLSARGDEGRLAGLADCGEHYCGRRKCSEVCRRGNRRRALQYVSKAGQLLSGNGHPNYLVCLHRDRWQFGKSELDHFHIEHAKKLVRRALEKILNHELVAVGAIHALADTSSGKWRFEVRLVVNGAERDDLEHALTLKRVIGAEYTCVQPVKDLQAALWEAFESSSEVWTHPLTRSVGARGEAKWRSTYYTWLETKRPYERVFRFGCDRHFKRIKKAFRSVRLPKKRPYPVWLERYQFGSWGHDMNCRCRRCNPPLEPGQ